MTARYDYDAWGNVLATQGTSRNEIGYTGQRKDTETGLLALGNGTRYYNAGLGSFTQQDSYTGAGTMPASLNRYAYVQGNPLRYTDPSGHTIHEGTLNETQADYRPRDDSFTFSEVHAPPRRETFRLIVTANGRKLVATCARCATKIVCFAILHSGECGG